MGHVQQGLSKNPVIPALVMRRKRSTSYLFNLHGKMNEKVRTSTCYHWIVGVACNGSCLRLPRRLQVVLVRNIRLQLLGAKPSNCHTDVIWFVAVATARSITTHGGRGWVFKEPSYTKMRPSIALCACDDNVSPFWFIWLVSCERPPI